VGDPRSVNWAIVGLGDIVRKRVAAAIVDQPDSRLYACVTRDPKARQDDLEAYAPDRVFTSIEPMLADPSVDAVYLATPVHRHAPQAIACLEAGKDVLVEKPMALDAREAAAMCRAADESGRRLAVAYYRRFWDRFQRVKDALDRGELGQVVLVRMALGGWYRPDPSDPGAWRTDRASAGGGVLSDVGCHRLDLVPWWLGLPRRVVADVKTLIHDYETDDSVAVLMELAHGAQFTGSFHWNTRARADEIDVVGTEGRIRMVPSDGPAIEITRAGRTTVETVPRPGNAHFPLIDDFVRAVLEGRPPRFHGVDSLATTRLIDAMYESSRRRAWIEVGEPS
jgi:predicted dehydrogenase